MAAREEGQARSRRVTVPREPRHVRTVVPGRPRDVEVVSDWGRCGQGRVGSRRRRTTVGFCVQTFLCVFASSMYCSRNHLRIRRAPPFLEKKASSPTFHLRLRGNFFGDKPGGINQRTREFEPRQIACPSAMLVLPLVPRYTLSSRFQNNTVPRTKGYDATLGCYSCAR